MSRIVFLLEEYSTKVLLDGLLPRLFPALQFLCVPHEGKQDLAKSIPRKLRAWHEPDVAFVVVRDNDGGDCRTLKRGLLALCREGGRKDCLVRIPCQEVEAWYIGDPNALAAAFGDPQLASIGAKERFRVPDDAAKPSRALAELVPASQKVSGARAMAAHMARERNSSRSFQVFAAGVERLAKAADRLRPEGCPA